MKGKDKESKNPKPKISLEAQGNDEEDVVDVMSHVIMKSEAGDGNLAKYISKRNKVVTTEQLLESWQIGDRKSDYIKHELFVEYLDKDMQWKIGQVDRIFDGKQVIDGTSTMYEIHGAGSFHDWRVRAARAGLEAYFGAYPWVFQQVMLLRVELHLRVQVDHEDDFTNFNIVDFASKMWDGWLECVRHDLVPEADDSTEERLKVLKKHILSPFVLMQSIADDDEDKGWNFTQEEVSLYTYLSLIGTGSLRGLAILLFQIFAPLIILYNNMLQTDGEPSERFETSATEGGLPANGEFFPSTDFEQFCSGNGRLEGRLVLFLVLLAYNFMLAPDSMLVALRFYIGGLEETTGQRIDCIRRNSWVAGRDTTYQELWYRIDYFMKTIYISMLYGILIFVLLNTPIALDIVLNAFAFGFIASFDEDVTKTMYWDEPRRWLRAGTISQLIKNDFKYLEIARSSKSLAEEFGLDPQIFAEHVGGKGLYDQSLAVKDTKNRKYHTFSQAYGEQVKDSFHEDDLNRRAGEKNGEVFMGVEAMIAKVLGREWGIFQQLRHFRVWSRWSIAITPIPGCDLKRGKLDGVHKIQIPVASWNHTNTPVNILVNLWQNLKVHSRMIALRPILASLRLVMKIILAVLEVFFTACHAIITFGVLFSCFFVPICY